jgi:NhaP-type Na+/H+ or K+/H+ antiporter
LEGRTEVKAIAHTQLGQLALLLVVALFGLGASLAFGWRGVEHSLGYMLLASALLCFGLYMAVFGIEREEALRNWKIVVVAITFGVACKYLLIFGATYIVTRDWHYAVLAMAVAQIDPLSVAALNNDKSISPRTRSIINMWASFDDPMTALLTPLILGLVSNAAHQDLAAGSGWLDVLVDILPFVVALLAVGLLALFRHRFSLAKLQQKLDGNEKSKGIGAVMIGVVAVPFRIFSLAASAGWFVRVGWLAVGRRAEFALNIALYGATFMLGILLAGGVDWLGGLVLGIATYMSQIVAAWLVRWGASRLERRENRAETFLPHKDTWQVAFTQQNGITAIILALNLESIISGSVAVVSFAIIVVNVLNFSVNSTFRRYAYQESV